MLPSLFLGFIYAAKRVTKSWSHPACILSYLYCGLHIAALFVAPEMIPSFSFNYPASSLFAYSLLLLISLLPALLISRPACPTFRLPFFRMTVLLIGLAALPAFFYLLPHAFVNVRSGADFTKSSLQTATFAALPIHVMTSYSVVLAMFYPLLACALVESRVSRRGVGWTIVYGLGSSLTIVYSLCFTNRDGVLWFAGSAFFALWLFWSRMSETDRRITLSLVAAVSIIGLAFSVGFTIQRFYNYQGTVMGGLLPYYGEQPYVFAENVATRAKLHGFDRRLPLLASLLQDEVFPYTSELAIDYKFGTFLTCFYSISGWPSLILLTAGGSILAAILLSASRGSPEAHSLTAAVYFQFMLQGLFYFRLGNRAGNVYLLISLLLILATLFKSKLARLSGNH